MTDFKIELGTSVRCKNTGFKGVVVARTEFINGCIQYSVVPKARRGEFPEEVGIDEGSLEVVSTPKKKQKKKDAGGPVTTGTCMRGF